MRRVQLFIGLVLVFFAVASGFMDDQVTGSFFAIGFLGGLFKGIGGAVKGIGSVFGKVAKTVAKVGVGVVGGITGLDALLQGGQVVATDQAGAQTIIVAPGKSPVQAGFLNQLMAFKVAGIPVVFIAAGGVGLYFLIKGR